MRKTLVILFFLCLGIDPLFAQAKKDTLTVKELQDLFNSHEPLNVLNIVMGSGNILDYKNYYESEYIKPKLMQWLDRELYLKEALHRIRNNYENDSIYLANKIKSYIKRHNISMASLSHTAYRLYEDTVVNKLMEMQETTIRRDGLPFPQPFAIEFHSKLAYRESYEKIKSFWQEDSEAEDSPFYIPLVYMGDPKARALFDQHILNVVKSNGDNINLNRLLGFLEGELRGSYGIEKSLELLTVDKKIALFSGDDEVIPFNCLILKFLVSQILYYKISIDNSVAKMDPCKAYTTHSEKIKEAGQRLIEYLRTQELYWMSNMPFYNK